MKKFTTIVTLALSMCVAIVGLGQANAQTMCTAQYDPVCGIDGKTYGNSCMAQGAEIAYAGECIVIQTNPNKACTKEYIPVCGVDGVTYSNACVADKVVVDYDGVCKGDESDNQDNQACTLEYMPVCGEVQVQCIKAPCPPIRTTYANSCSAKADGATIIFEAECRAAESGPIVMPHSPVDSDAVSGVMGLKDTIIWAYENGITRYNTLDTFMPEQTITREQAAKMLVAAVESDQTLMLPMLKLICGFDDQATIDYTLLNDVLKSCQYNLFRGYNGNFMPKNLLNNTDTNTLFSRIGENSQGVSEYLATNPIPADYAATSRGMYVTYLYNMMMKHRSPTIDTTPMDMTQNQKDLNKSTKLWKNKGMKSYTFSQSKSCFCPTDYTRSMTYNVFNGVIVTGSLMYTDDMSKVSIETNLHTVDQAFAMIQQAIDDKVASLTVEYDIATGYPTSISIDRDIMIADEEMYYTFEIVSSEIETGMGSGDEMMTNNLIGSYTLESYDGTGSTNTGITIMFDKTKVSTKICNSMSADYTMSGNKLMFSSMISTMMYCDDQMLMNLESSIGMITGSTYELSGSRLTIMANNHTWTFIDKATPKMYLANDYILTSYDGTANTDTGITLKFDNEKAYAKICNSISSNYTASDSVITFDSMISTKMACVNETLTMLESNFSRMTKAEYVIKNNMLTIMVNNHTWVWMK